MLQSLDKGFGMEEKEMEQYEKAGFKKITGDELGTLTFNPFDKIRK